jgi:hypothetical protein
VVLEVLVAGARRKPIAAALAQVALFAVARGHAHGVELPSAADPVAFTVGFVIELAPETRQLRQGGALRPEARCAGAGHEADTQETRVGDQNPMGVWIATGAVAAEVANPPTLETMMQTVAD